MPNTGPYDGHWDPPVLAAVDPEQEPFVIVVGGTVGEGQFGNDDSPDAVQVVVNEIHYLPYDAEPQDAPRIMKLVLPSEMAIALGENLVAAGRNIPTVEAQAEAVLSTNKENN